MSNQPILNGPMPPDWSIGSPVYIDGGYTSGGLVWMGMNPATPENIAAATLALGDDTVFDYGTFYGRLDRRYKAYPYRIKNIPDPCGGLGSFTYQNQKVGYDVKFAEEMIFYFDESGNYVKGIPPNCGAHHSNYYGEATVGPRPGSESEEILGEDGKYTWDEDNEYWVVVRD